ncbi:hypothetical protein ACFQT0_19800 [Hymenobacter humi]|uniref:Amidohydrolase-related domain-containing protein n=1 Tax=Hymenobacter humi TaxID=1411620 RepID=A0ABW2UA74_9BACT
MPTPALPQARPMLITGATLHVGNGTVVPNATVAFDKGRLTYAGPAAGFTQDRAGYETIDAAGQQLYPGLIVPNTTLGLTEVESVRATVDEQEVGTLNPNVRAIIAYNTDSDIMPTVRTNGVLLAQPTPRGGLLSGQSSVVQARRLELAGRRGAGRRRPAPHLAPDGVPAQPRRRRRRPGPPPESPRSPGCATSSSSSAKPMPTASCPPAAGKTCAWLPWPAFSTAPKPCTCTPTTARKSSNRCALPAAWACRSWPW